MDGDHQSTRKWRKFTYASYKFRIMTAFWKLARIERLLHRIPVFHQWLKKQLDVSTAENEAVIIPVSQSVSGSESIVLPYPVLEPLIRAASGHLILNRCPCRTAENCHAAPHDFGCLYLGQAVRSVPEDIGRQVTTRQALDHLQQGLALGLVPMIVHASFDADLLSIPYNRMLAICFCCNCCCTVRNHLRLGPSTFDETIHRLPGLTVTIRDCCTACGDCIPRCPVQAIRIVDGMAHIDQERCKGCGVCASVCPNEAPVLQFDHLQENTAVLYDRIRRRTDIGI